MRELAVKLGYEGILTSNLHSRNAFLSTPRLGARLYRGILASKITQVIDIIDKWFLNGGRGNASKSAYRCSKMKAKEWVAGGKIGVRLAINSQSLKTAICRVSFQFYQQFRSLKAISFHRVKGFIAGFRHGGIVTTQAQIKKTKEELQKLRRQFLEATGDNEMLERIAEQIRRRKSLLAELGAK